MDRPTSRFRSAPHMPLAQSVWTGNCIAYIVPKLGVPAHLLPMVPHCVAPDRTPFRVVVEWDRNLALLGAGTRPRVAGSSDMPLEGLEGHTHTLAPHTCSGSGGEGPTRPKFGEIYAGPAEQPPWKGKNQLQHPPCRPHIWPRLAPPQPPAARPLPPACPPQAAAPSLAPPPAVLPNGRLSSFARGATHSQLAAAHSPFASAVATDPFLGERRGGAC